MVVSGLARTIDDLERLAQTTFLARSDPPYRGIELNLLLEEVLEDELIRCDERGHLQPSPVGRVVATVGLTCDQGVHFQKRLADGLPHTRQGWLAFALSAPDWSPPPGMVGSHDNLMRYPFAMLREHLEGSREELNWLLDEVDLSQPLSYHDAAALKAVFLIDRWCQAVPVRQLEERFQMHLGQIKSLGATVAHLLHGVARILSVNDPVHPELADLCGYCFEARHGLPAELTRLHRLLGGVLSRSDFVALMRADIESPEGLAEGNPERLLEVGIAEDKTRKINDIITSLREEHEMNSNSQVVSRDLGKPVIPMTGQPESVEVDGECYKERYLVKINGFSVRLTGKSFKYFTRLAWSRINSESGWVYKEDLEAGFNQARYLYRMKNEIAAAFTSTWSIVENNRLGYYRLDIDPSRLSLNLDSLKQHPDYEVSSLAQGEDYSLALGHG